MKRLEKDVLAYIAGIVDGEGCIAVSVRSKNPTTRMPKVAVKVVMCDLALIAWLREVTGVGCVSVRSRIGHRRPNSEWMVSGCEISSLLRALLPWLRTKRAQAELALAIRRLMPGARRRPGARKLAKAHRLRLEVSTLNRRGMDVAPIKRSESA